MEGVDRTWDGGGLLPRVNGRPLTDWFLANERAAHNHRIIIPVIGRSPATRTSTPGFRLHRTVILDECVKSV